MAVHVYAVDVLLSNEAQRPTEARIFDSEREAAAFARDKRRLGFKAIAWEM